MYIQNRILDIINSYCYEEEVCSKVKEFNEDTLKEGEIIYLNPEIDDVFAGDSEEQIANKVADVIIRYKIKEKVYMKLMSRGTIYPIQIGEGQFQKRVKYKYKNIEQSADLFFNRCIFTQFLKV